jgi:hypothetical protein
MAAGKLGLGPSANMKARTPPNKAVGVRNISAIPST